MLILRAVIQCTCLFLLPLTTIYAQDIPVAPITSTNAAAAAAILKLSEKDASYDDIAVLTETIMLVQRNSVEEHKFRDLIYGAIDGMLASLDPHSAFLPPEEFDALREETAGQFSGIGVTVGIREGIIVVIAPIEDSPAFRAGLHAGDRIVAINGQPNRGTTMNEAVGKLRGPRGSTVKLMIERDDRDPFEVTILRDDVRVASVIGTRILRNAVGYIRINVFSEQTPVEFETAFRKILDLKASALVLDLRDNPGGLLDTAVAVAEKLLAEKAVVVTTRGRDGVRNEEQFRAGGDLRNTDIPVVVLINRGSASASEIVAGALQDHKRAVIMGETSFGKASVQNVIRLRLRPECAVRLTTAHYFTPLGRMIHGKGIIPDVVVSQTPGEWRKAQLKRLYDETPASYPVNARENIGAAMDAPLERAIDLLVGVRILDGKK